MVPADLLRASGREFYPDYMRRADLVTSAVPADKGRDELHFRLRGAYRLWQRKEQCHVALDPFFLQLFGRINSLPC